MPGIQHRKVTNCKSWWTITVNVHITGKPNTNNINLDSECINNFPGTENSALSAEIRVWVGFTYRWEMPQAAPLDNTCACFIPRDSFLLTTALVPSAVVQQFGGLVQPPFPPNAQQKTHHWHSCRLVSPSC